MVTRRWLVLLAPIGVGLIATGLGVWRLMPDVGYWDTAEFQTVPPILGTAHPTGYPTYVILGWLASITLGPLGEAAFRMNLLSAIFVGVAAAITVDLARMLTGSTILGVVAGLGLATTPIVWTIGTHADPHALHLALVAGLFWLLVRWERERSQDPSRADRWLVAGAALTGLSAGNHSLTLLLAPSILLYVIAVEPRILARVRLVATCVAAFVIATGLVYLQLPIRGGAVPGLTADLVYGRPDTLGGFVYVVTGEQFRGGLNDPFGNLPRKVGDLVALAVSQLGPLAALALAGLVATAIRFPAYALFTGTALAITCFFNAAYVNAEIERYYLGPALIAWTWLAILARAVVDQVTGLPLDEEAAVDAHDAQETPGPAPAAPGGILRPGPLRLATATLVGLLLLGPTFVAFPARATAVDRTADTSARRWLDTVLTELPKDAVVVSWWSFSTPLWYAQHIEGQRLDIRVVDDRTRLDQGLGDVTDVIDANLGERPVFVIRVDTKELDELRKRYNLTPSAPPSISNVLRVTPLAAGVSR